MFLIDQGIGVHHAQVESLGYGWSWVSDTYDTVIPDAETISGTVQINRTFSGTVKVSRTMAWQAQINRTVSGIVER